MGTADSDNSTSTPEAPVISLKWPMSPNPVTSVQADAPCSFRISAARLFGWVMESSAAAIQRPLALPRISAAKRTPVPSGLVRMSLSPVCSPCLRRTPSCSAKPVTVKPRASSSPSLVWPPTSAAPASEKISCAPSSN